MSDPGPPCQPRVQRRRWSQRFSPRRHIARVREGELAAIIGPSGCGKTTLLNLISGLEPLSDGEILVNGQPPRAGAENIAYMFARDVLLPWRTAIQNVELPLQVRGVEKEERLRRAHRALEDVGLADFANAYRSELSQGMRQRVALARTIALEPRILLMDEPFSALDAQTRLSVQEKFVDLRNRKRTTAVLITHDFAEAVALADRVVVMGRRPAQITSIFNIDLPTPRSVLSLQSDEHFHRQYEVVWQALSKEVAADA